MKGAKALVEEARLNLEYAHVKAPISGKTSRAEITIGNLVKTGGDAPLLTSIANDDKVYVDFEVDEQTYLKMAHSLQKAGSDAVGVRLKLGNQIEYNGKVHSFDNRIDPTSGTIRARAIFTNQDKILLPGMSVSVLMGSAKSHDEILISERAIGTDQDRKFVYVIDKNGLASYREIKIGESVQGKRIVHSGLKPGDIVITEGIVRIRPGMPVIPKTDTPMNQAASTTAEKE